MKKIFLLVILTVTTLFFGCEKEISIDDLPQPSEKIVVEGHIEPGELPYVYLSINAAYFAPTDFTSYQQYLIQDALVIITDGFTSDTLTEVYPTLGYFYKADNMTGVVGRTYTITITALEKTVTATTTIPQPVALDTLWFELFSPETNDSLGFVWTNLTDPTGLGNNYRWMAKRLGKDNDFVAPLGSVFDDKFFDGQSFEFAYNRGSLPNSTVEDDQNEERGFFKKGDVVVIKFCSLDYEAFEFYRSFEIDLFSSGNPFASPASVKSNVFPEEYGLGCFCGYGAALDTVVLVP